MNDNWTRVKAHLERQGLMTPDGVTRKVTARTCRGCHAPVLAGLDGDLVARDARTDPDALTTLGEALALIAGRATWFLRRNGGRYELDPRDQWSIRGKPAGAGRYDVLAEHRCGSPPLPSTESAHTTTDRKASTTGPPPF